MHIFHEAGKVARCEASDITRFHSHASHIISYHQLSCTSYYELSPTLMHLISRAFTNSHAPHITSLSPTLMHLTSHRFHQLSCTSHHIAFTNSHAPHITSLSPTLIMRTLGREGRFPFLLVFLIKRTPLKNHFGVVLQEKSSSSGFLVWKPPNKETPPPRGGGSYDQLERTKEEKKDRT